MIKENIKPINKKRRKSNQSIPRKIGITYKNEEINRNKFESLNKLTVQRYKNQPSQK